MDVYQIVITRKESLIGCALKHTVEVDGVPVGVLKNGETLAAYTTPGPHAISFIDRGKVRKSVSILIEPEHHVFRLFVELYGQQKVRVTQEDFAHPTSPAEDIGDCEAYGIDAPKGARRRTQKRSIGVQIVQAVGLTIIVLAIALWGCYFFFGRSASTLPQQNASSLGGDNVPASDAIPTPTPITSISISAEDLWTAYTDNVVNADNLYKDKLIAVSGTISNIGKDIVTDAPCISLDSGDSLGIYAIQCFFPQNTDQNGLIASLHDGDTITIYGVCRGTPVMNVQLSGCFLSE